MLETLEEARGRRTDRGLGLDGKAVGASASPRGDAELGTRVQSHMPTRTGI